ncbi:hypothetical protein [Pedobacter polysacchareus]|uniref:hypothetical protein n=1 Tax=Pedobacter polysacchareus TaxID=2861973 RepID=UPI001C994C86|nr:hypothetical protein [Pedobacter polysacchareus]
MNYIAVLTYSQQFSEKPPKDPLIFIRPYPTDFILLKLSKINAILFQEGDEKTESMKVLKEVIYVDTFMQKKNS